MVLVVFLGLLVVLPWSSGGPPVVLWWSSGPPLVVLWSSSGGPLVVLWWSSGGPLVVSGGPLVVPGCPLVVAPGPLVVALGPLVVSGWWFGRVVVGRCLGCRLVVVRRLVQPAGSRELSWEWLVSWFEGVSLGGVYLGCVAWVSFLPIILFSLTLRVFGRHEDTLFQLDGRCGLAS